MNALGIITITIFILSIICLFSGFILKKEAIINKIEILSAIVFVIFGMFFTIGCFIPSGKSSPVVATEINCYDDKFILSSKDGGQELSYLEVDTDGLVERKTIKLGKNDSIKFSFTSNEEETKLLSTSRLCIFGFKTATKRFEYVLYAPEDSIQYDSPISE